MAIYFAVSVSGACSDSMEHEIYGVDATGGARTRTLPDVAKCRGAVKTVVKTDASANAVTVDTTSSQQIAGPGGSAATKALSTQGAAVTVVATATGWQVIATA